MNTSPSSSGLLPLPGSPSSSWAVYRARLAGLVQNADTAVLVAFWFFGLLLPTAAACHRPTRTRADSGSVGLINNVLYVIILSAAQDLVGNVPKGVVLLADVMPSFLTKLVAPYFIHRIPYATRILIFVGLSSAGMLLVAFTPPEKSVAVKLVGVVLSSLSSGGGELSFLGLTHYYGHMSLAAWGSGTGGAGLIGAGLYVLLTDWLGLTVKTSLLASAFLPVFMLLSFFVILPRGPLNRAAAAAAAARKEYEPVPGQDVMHGETEETFDDIPAGSASSSLLAPGPAVASTAYSHHSHHDPGKVTFLANLRLSRSLFFPYMLPLLLVYIAEYTINQGVAPTLLFPLEQSPFSEFRAFYPFYGFLYQLGVFISRSSMPFIRIHFLYLPSLLQVANLVLLTLHALLNFIPSVYLVFVVVFWEGLLGGAVYVNTFAEIMENVPVEEREFSLGATSVSDSGGICVAGFIGMAMEVSLCDWQVQHGRDWCRRVNAG
ncbi:batten's disease protein Cln3 [Lasiosphaeris hirsuta]|uniref:Protein BTN n=1 Tax=Lasiosphaeris hirsuta TaxID=260670 RepID=A0AA40DJP5_9PEZI|nr:batten's disease protein Cln3 [Lasiosphaeris hirsuta]